MLNDEPYLIFRAEGVLGLLARPPEKTEAA